MPPTSPDGLLTRTFLHVPGIGPHRERQLWQRGYRDWETFRRLHPAGRWRELILSRLDTARAVSDLPAREAWRLLSEFRGRTAYVDIETEGTHPEAAITCVGLYDGTRPQAFVRGRNLDQFPGALRRFELLVTYNGSSFDLPRLRTEFPGLLRNGANRLLAHLDLRYPLYRLGFRGGLKEAERRIGLTRAAEVRGVDGRLAVLLWRAHRRGRAGALDTLVRYCLEDTANLEPLAAHVYNTMIRTLPFEVPPIETTPAPALPWRADAGLVRELIG